MSGASIASMPVVTLNLLVRIADPSGLSLISPASTLRNCSAAFSACARLARASSSAPFASPVAAPAALAAASCCSALTTLALSLVTRSSILADMAALSPFSPRVIDTTKNIRNIMNRNSASGET
ncbi:MAG: hypothetical protein V4723_17010 [Pseudomonadota bacterium]